jgi:hypothetical protein
VRRYLARSGDDVVWDLIRLAHSTVSVMAVIPMQDLMDLGNEARMNLSRAAGRQLAVALHGAGADRHVIAFAAGRADDALRAGAHGGGACACTSSIAVEEA